MSQMVTRKSAVSDDKSTRQTDSPVKDTKKKVAANSEKEKQVEKPTDKKDKTAEKVTDKKDKPAEKVTEQKDKPAEKVTEQKDKPAEKVTDKKDKPAEKVTDKKDKPAEKAPEKKDKKADDNKDKSLEKKETGDKKADAEKDKGQKNGKPEPAPASAVTQNGSNGVHAAGPDSVSSDEELLIIEEDEAFPELAYEDDDDRFESATPERLRRSITRREQVKTPRTPETPRPPSAKQTAEQVRADSPSLLNADKQPETEVLEESKDGKDKVLKLKEDPPSERKLRSSDVKEGEKEKDAADKSADAAEVVIVIDEEGEGDRRKPDTNYSKSRVKVSPYRRSVRLDQTNTSLQANYTGNNTTMEMDITETSISDPPLDDSSYLSGLRSIKGRRSYKPLKEMTLRRIVNTSNISNVTLSDQGRPTVTVVGRKRRPESPPRGQAAPGAAGKRARLIDRIPLPFRRAAPQTAPEIVGINTDLPLSAPLPSPDISPESLKLSPGPAPLVAPLQPAAHDKKCIIM